MSFLVGRRVLAYKFKIRENIVCQRAFEMACGSFVKYLGSIIPSAIPMQRSYSVIRSSLPLRTFLLISGSFVGIGVNLTNFVKFLGKARIASPIGPSVPRGPLVPPSNNIKSLFAGSSSMCNRHISHCNARLSSSSKYRMEPLCWPVLTIAPSRKGKKEC